MNYLLMAALMLMSMVFIMAVFMGTLHAIMLMGVFVSVSCMATRPDSPPSFS
jgi:hypothetical protein